MPVLKRPDGEIYYEEYGQGYPILLFAPGGMRSRAEMWHDPGRRAAAAMERLDTIARRQLSRHRDGPAQRRPFAHRDRGQSRLATPYAADHLALMDHLGFRQFHTLGGCIGGSFCLKLCEIAPERVTAAVLQNPIGLHPDHPEYFPESFVEWATEQKAERPQLDDAKIAAFGKNMWDGEFVFCVSREFCRRCTVPTFLLPGIDKPHPAVTSAELAQAAAGHRGADRLARSRTSR